MNVCSYCKLVLIFVINRWKISEFKPSPNSRRRDMEAGATDNEVSSSVFDITTTKHASAERLKRWRVS